MSGAATAAVVRASKAAGEIFSKAVRPIYGVDNRDRPEHIGSGVLLQYRGQKYLLTAAHVLDQAAWTTLYIGANVLTPIQGEVLSTVPPRGKRKLDHVDFAVFPLVGSVAEAFAPCAYLTAGQTVREPGKVPGHIFTAIGYPNSKNDKVDDARKAVTPRIWRYSGTRLDDSAKPKRYARCGDIHVLVKRDKRYALDEDGERVHRFGGRGMSGGALVDLGMLATPDILSGGQLPEPALCGINIEDASDAGCFVAIQIGPILDAIDRSFPRSGPP